MYGPHEVEYTDLMKSISLTLLLLTITYLMFLLPLIFFERCSLVDQLSLDYQAAVASWLVLGKKIHSCQRCHLHLLVETMSQWTKGKKSHIYVMQNELYLASVAPSCTCTCRYWWLYGVNFLTYLISNSRIRAAYRQFFKDVRQAVWRRQPSSARNDNSSTVFKDELRDMSSENSALRKTSK